MQDEIPGIGGGGTATGDTGGGGAAVAEHPAEETVVIPGEGGTPAEAGKPGEGGEPEKTEDELVAEYETEGKRLEAKTRAAIAALKKTDPVAAKTVADAYFRNVALTKEFPEAKDFGEALQMVKQNNALLESVGGREGLEGLQEEANDYRTEIEQFANGDPALLAKLYEANAEGLVTAASNTLELLASKDMKHFDEAVTPFIDKRLEKAGIDTSLFTLAKLIQDGKGQEAYDLVVEMTKWRASVKAIAREITEKRGSRDPREEQFRQREQRLDEEKSELVRKTIETDVNRMNAPALAKVIAPLAKEIGLSPEGRREFENGLIQRVWNVLRKDPVYMARVKTLRGKGDAAATADCIHGQFREALQAQFELHRNHVYPHLAKRRPAVTTKTGTAANGAGGGAAAGTKKPDEKGGTAAVAGNFVQIAQRPKHEEVDWDNTPDVMWITGKAVLKGGKKVQFKF
jgi:hypothetical protein